MTKKEWYDYDNVDWTKVTKEHTEYTLNEANACLKTSLESCEALDKKAFILLVGITIYISVLLPFVFASKDNTFLVPSFILIGGFVLTLGLLIPAIKTRQYYAMGNRPKNILIPESLTADYTNFLHSEIVSRQDWIKENEQNNTIKGKFINLSLMTLLASIVLALIADIIIKSI